MAHFHKIPSGERISGQSIDVTKSSILIGLWGYLDFDKKELVVVPVTEGATAVPKKIDGNSRQWLITPSVCGRLRFEARTVDGQVWDWVELNFTTHEAVVAAERKAVIDEAKRHVGAHYLWGAAGATPGGHEGMPGRPSAVNRVADRLDAHNPCLRAASCSVDGYHVCGGRYKEVGNTILQPTDPDLKTYLDGLRGTPPDSWQPMNDLWPRMMEGKTVTTQIVLGESCLATRHFDCVGFINYCFSIVQRKSVQDSISGWINNSIEITDKSDEPADILTIGDHHIGFAMGDGRAIHASQTSRGVVIDLLAGGGWKRRGRFLH